MNFPITPAVRYLREKKIGFEPHLFEYVEKGGTKHSSAVLGFSEHLIIKTLVFETNEKTPLIILMHGDLQVSNKKLARHLMVKHVASVSPERAENITGYIVGGTSPFGLKSKIRIFAEKSIFNLDRIFINGGKRGFLIEIVPQVLKDILDLEEVEVGIEKL